MDRPGEWARVFDAASINSAKTLAYRLRSRKAAKPDGTWEFATREQPEGGGAVYARYMGEMGQ